MWERILPALPLLLLFLLGYLLRKISFFDEGGLKALKRVRRSALPAIVQAFGRLSSTGPIWSSSRDLLGVRVCSSSPSR